MRAKQLAVKIIAKEAALARLAAHKHELLAGRGGCVMCALANGGASAMLVAESVYAVVLLDEGDQLRADRRTAEML